MGRTVRHIAAHRLVVRSWVDRQGDTDHQQEGVPPRAGDAVAGMVVAVGMVAVVGMVVAVAFGRGDAAP